MKKRTLTPDTHRRRAIACRDRPRRRAAMAGPERRCCVGLPTERETTRLTTHTIIIKKVDKSGPTHQRLRSTKCAGPGSAGGRVRRGCARGYARGSGRAPVARIDRQMQQRRGRARALLAGRERRRNGTGRPGRARRARRARRRRRRRVWSALFRTTHCQGGSILQLMSAVLKNSFLRCEKRCIRVT